MKIVFFFFSSRIIVANRHRLKFCEISSVLSFIFYPRHTCNQRETMMAADNIFCVVCTF
jgi:hypothetical protein